MPEESELRRILFIEKSASLHCASTPLCLRHLHLHLAPRRQVTLGTVVRLLSLLLPPRPPHRTGWGRSKGTAPLRRPRQRRSGHARGSRVHEGRRSSQTRGRSRRRPSATPLGKTRRPDRRTPPPGSDQSRSTSSDHRSRPCCRWCAALASVAELVARFEHHLTHAAQQRHVRRCGCGCHQVSWQGREPSS
jgi:hypothetical protein